MSSSGSSATYSVANAVTNSWINSNSPSVTLYAHWNANPVTVIYKGNGNTGGSMTNQTCYYNQNCTLKTNGFEKTGHSWKGWFISANGGNALTSPLKLTGNTTVYAQWKPNNYTLTYIPSGLCNPATKTVTFGSAYGTLCSPTKTGYLFEGWYTAASGGTRVTANTKMTTLGAKIYARFTANNYTLTYNNNGGSGCTSKTVTYGSAYGTLCAPTRSGYSFAGWYTAASGGTKVDANTKMTTTGATIYAHWTANQYSISYTLNEGSVSGNPTTYNTDTNTFTLKNPTRPNYKFTGWSGTGISGKSTSVSIPKGSSGNRSYTANWISNNITFEVRLKSGETIAPRTVYNDSVSNWTTDSSGLLYRNGVLYTAVKSRGTEVNVDLPNYGYNGFINISKPNYGASWDSAWKCESGCRRANQTFSQGEIYMNLDDIVADNNVDGIIILNVNWRAPAVLITVGVNGGTITSSPINPSNAAFGDRHYYLGSGEETVYKSDQNPYHHELAVGESLGSSGLVNYNNPEWLFISPPSGKSGPSGGSAWKGGHNCALDTYSQSKVYTSSDFCTPTTTDCICHLRVNWK